MASKQCRWCAPRRLHITHSEINGTIVPSDLGFGKIVSAAKPQFIDKHMLGREGLNAAGRHRLVVPLDPATSFRSGSHILAKDAAATLENDHGYVTSNC